MRPDVRSRPPGRACARRPARPGASTSSPGALLDALLGVLLLAALLGPAGCVADRPEEVRPSAIVWWATAPLPPLPTVGEIDPGRIVEAYYASEMYSTWIEALQRERTRAMAAGDTRLVAELRSEEDLRERVRKRDLEKRSSPTAIILQLEGILAFVAAQHAVQVVAEEGTWRAEAKARVDLTEEIVSRLPAR